ncbi:ABC transporter permease [Kribbia dieselivorans]|uniref:ABC transporter permease n=1 Tax=Kribbia dieselivorans TaxID=331526 RepID=UPI0008384FA5|nr:ABC transporter permease [Kribbia dieselivorans]
MLWRLLTRTGVLLVSLAVASVAVFATMNILPGDPAEVALGVNATEGAKAALRTEFGLDRPLPVQYADWMGGMLTFDPGISYVSKAAIGPQVLDRLLVTLWLVGAAMALAILVAVPMGTWMAVRHRHPDGVALAAVSQVGVAVPAFLVGVLFIAVFAVRLRWLPSGGWVAPADDPVEFVRHLVLPATALALVQAAVLSRYVRSAVLDVLREDYLRTARAKGLTPVGAMVRHGLRNAAIPVVTVLGLQLATLLVGAVVVEQVFTLPGLGTLLLGAVGQRDLLMVQTVVMLLVAAVLIINWLVDLVYVVLDPRLRVAR